MDEFKFDPVQLMLKVNDHSNGLAHLKEMLSEHIADDKESFEKMRKRMERLAEATEKLEDSIDRLIHQTEGAMWATGKFWAAIVFFSGISFSLAKFVKIGG